MSSNPLILSAVPLTSEPASLEISALNESNLFESRLMQAKLESLAEFAAGAGHELNNPLATILGRAQLLLKAEKNPDRRRDLTTIVEQTLRARDMIGDLMVFGRPPLPRFSKLALGTVVQDVLSRFEQQLKDRHLNLVGNWSGPCEIAADATQVAVVVSELLRNALNALPTEGARLQIDVGHEDNTCFLRLANNGPPFTEIEREHLFDPFFSGRQAGRGLGFGLCKVWRIVMLHQGRIAVSSDSSETAFVIHWPTSRPELET